MSQQNVQSFFRGSSINNQNRTSLSSRFSRSSRIKPEGHEGAVPKIIMRRETHFGQNQGMPNLPDEYLLTLSDDSDYCSSDWESETDTELDPDEMKKEGRIGWGLFIFTTVYLAVLITAYVVTSNTPLCVCHEDHPKYNTSKYKDTYCTKEKYKLEKGSINYKKCTQYIKHEVQIDEKLQINDTFVGEDCTMQYIEINSSEDQFIFSCNEHLYDVEEADEAP